MANRDFDRSTVRLIRHDPILGPRAKARELRLAQLDNEFRVLSRNYARIQSRNMRMIWEERRRKLWDEERKLRVEQIDDDNYFNDTSMASQEGHRYRNAFGLGHTGRFAREPNGLSHIPHRALQEGYMTNLPGTSGRIYSSHQPSKPVNSLYKNQTKPVNRASTVKNTLSSRKGGRRNSRATRRRR
jgi:hypothetical protein